ncbi:DUF998 domain-containing protein [Streptomyces sp. NPDC050636]|uniref:DUF998 domain-containing protein n=1 Tax=Streptomyces sp. NPDC050636 TaxID=3154510 RepID=UPI003441C2FC
MCAVLYTAWITEIVLITGEDPMYTYVSELAATDQPYGYVFRTTDLISGSCAIAASALALLCLEHRPWVTAGWAAFSLFGVATVLDSRYPLSCALVADYSCFALDDAGLAPVSHTVHAVTSGVAVSAFLTAMTSLTIAARRYNEWPVLARYGAPICMAQWAVNFWLMCAVIAFHTRHINWWLGLAERLQALLLAVWTVVLASCLARRPMRQALGNDSAAADQHLTSS